MMVCRVQGRRGGFCTTFIGQSINTLTYKEVVVSASPETEEAIQIEEDVSSNGDDTLPENSQELPT